MNEVRARLRAAISIAEKLRPGIARDGALGALGGVFARAGNASPALRVHLDEAVKVTLEVEPPASALELLAILAEVENLLVPATSDDPLSDVRAASAPSSRFASDDLPRLRPAPSRAFVAPGEEADEEPPEPTEEELERGPLAPEAWFAEEDDVPEPAPDVDGGALLATLDRDLDAVDFAAPPPPPIALGEGGEPIARDVFLAEVAASCLETMTSLARDREVLPFHRRAAAERRILEQLDAIAHTGEARLETITAAWMASRDRPEPFATWAALFALTSFDGPEPLRAARFVVDALEATELGHARVAVEALLASPHPSIVALASSFIGSSRPASRAVGVELAASFGRLSSEELAGHARDANAIVAIAALRAADRAGPTDVMREALRDRLHHPASHVAFQVARLATLWGDRTPYEEVKAGGALRERLGVRALDLLALRGDLEDQRLFETCHARLPPSAASFAAIARFGHPASVAFLTHFLTDDDLGEAAERALVFLLGDRVPRKARRNPTAWKHAADGTSTTRVRHGEPWSTLLLAREVERGELARVELLATLDELRLALRGAPAVDVAPFARHLAPILSDFVGRFSRAPD